LIEFQSGKTPGGKPLKLNKERIASLSHRLVDHLADGEYLSLNLERPELARILDQVITEELAQEDRLNEEVERILKAYESEIDKGNLDYRKMFQMTKKQIARDRGIIL